jgi:hypothetical protein
MGAEVVYQVHAFPLGFEGETAGAEVGAKGRFVELEALPQLGRYGVPRDHIKIAVGPRFDPDAPSF